MTKRRKVLLQSVKLTGILFSWLLHLVNSEPSESSRGATSSGNEPEIFNNFFDPKYHDDGRGNEPKIIEYKPVESVQQFSVITPSESYSIDNSYEQKVTPYPKEEIKNYVSSSSGNKDKSARDFPSFLTKFLSKYKYSEKVPTDIYYNQADSYKEVDHQIQSESPKVLPTNSWTQNSQQPFIKWPQEIPQHQPMKNNLYHTTPSDPSNQPFISHYYSSQPVSLNEPSISHPPQIISNFHSGVVSESQRKMYSPEYYHGRRHSPDYSQFSSPQFTHFQNFVKSILPQSLLRSYPSYSYKPPHPTSLHLPPDGHFENSPPITNAYNSYIGYQYPPPPPPVKATSYNPIEDNYHNGYPGVEYQTKPSTGSLSSFYDSDYKLPNFDDGFGYPKNFQSQAGYSNQFEKYEKPLKSSGKPLKSYYKSIAEYYAKLADEYENPPVPFKHGENGEYDKRNPSNHYSDSILSRPYTHYDEPIEEGPGDYFDAGWRGSYRQSSSHNKWPSPFSSRPSKYKSPYGSIKKPGSVSDEYQFHLHQSSYGAPSDLQSLSTSGYFYNHRDRQWQRVPYFKPEISYGIPKDLEEPSSFGYYRTINGAWTRVPYANKLKGHNTIKYSTLSVPLEEDNEEDWAGLKELDPNCENKPCDSIRGFSSTVDLTHTPKYPRRPRRRRPYSLFKRLIRNIVHRNRGRSRRQRGGRRRPCRGTFCNRAY